MSDSGKNKRSRKHRGNRRKNKQKEGDSPVTRKEDNICAETTATDDRNKNICAESVSISDKENQINQNDLEESTLDKCEKVDSDIGEKENIANNNAEGDHSSDTKLSKPYDLENVSSHESIPEIHRAKIEKYRVESPKLPRKEIEKKKLQNNTKSKSLDNDDDFGINIVDITEIDYKSDDDRLAEANAIISEAESDVEWEVADELQEEKKEIHKLKGQVTITPIPLVKADAEEISSLSPQDELNLRNFLQTLNLSTSASNSPKHCVAPPEIADVENKEEKENEDLKQRRARKKAALEEHFLPQFINPRILDVIDEEGSSESSETTRRQSSLIENRELQHRYDDLDDDVFITEKKIKEPKDVFPKPKDYFACKKELKRQQECLLVGAKILETEVEEGCGEWTIQKIEEQRGADIVYLDDSSSSASEVDNGGETDFINEDERVTIKTPTIEIDNQLPSNGRQIPSYTVFKMESFEKNTNDKPEEEKKCDESEINKPIEPTPPSTETKIDSHEEINESLESLLVPAPVPAACNEVIIMANEFVDELPIVTEILKDSKLSLEKVNSDKMLNCEGVNHNGECLVSNTSGVSSGEEMSDGSSKEYSRQDSSSSVCSSHSTSQSTAKYNPQSSSLTDIAAIVHDDLTCVPEVDQNYTRAAELEESLPRINTNLLKNVTGLQENNFNQIDGIQTQSHLNDPSSLRELCVHRVAALPHGNNILEELAEVSESLNLLTCITQSEIESDPEQASRMPYDPKPDLSAIKKIAMLQKQSNSSPAVQNSKIPPPVTPRQSSFKVLRDEPPWIGLASQSDPKLLACLSPSQKNQLDRTKNTANDEAGELIDMHCKYVERRGYDESHASREKAPPASNNIDDNIPVQVSGGDARTVSSPGSTNRLLAIIRDPELNPDAAAAVSEPDNPNPPKSTFNFMETLRSFEDMNKKLAEEEQQYIWSKNDKNCKESLEVTETFSSNKSFKANTKKNKENEITTNKINISKFEPIDVPILFTTKPFQHSKDVDNDLRKFNACNVNIKKSYHSTGNLSAPPSDDHMSRFKRLQSKRAFLLEDPMLDSVFENDKFFKIPHFSMNGLLARRSSLPKEIHDRQLEYIVQKEKEIEEHIRQLEELRKDNRRTSGPRAPMLPYDKEREVVTARIPRYHISRQGDIATIQSEIRKEFSSNLIKPERPPSLTSIPSNGEKFRDQMYSEYMDKVAEREERKQHKVIKISNSPSGSTNNVNNIVPKTSTTFTESIFNDFKKSCNQIEEEFINRAKMRWDKLGIKDPETEDEKEKEHIIKVERDNSIATENQPVVIEHKIKVMEGDKEKDVQKLPNHLQEFVKFTSSGDEAGVWSPGGSSQVRKEEPSASKSDIKGPSSSKPITSTSQHSSLIPNGIPPGLSSSSTINKSFLSETFSSSSATNSNSIKKLDTLDKPSSSIANNTVTSKEVLKKNKVSPSSGPTTSNVPIPPPPPPLPVWTPKSQPSSPKQERKEFRPVTFESPSLSRKNLLQDQPKPEASAPWEKRLAGSQSAPAAPGLSGLAAPAPPPPPAPALPRAQNPTITLLQKAREGQLPRGAAYLHQERERERDREPPRDRRSPPRVNPGEIVYTIRREYSSDTESGGGRRRMEATPRKYDGIGPTTKDGMPIGLRSEVKETNQSKWYKKMYDTIHKNKFDDDYVTVRYKSRRAHPSGMHMGPRNTSQYAYFDPRSGYLSEPEGGRGGWMSDAYDSDASAHRGGGRRHSALDRSRGGDKENEVNEYMPNTNKYSTLASAKASQEIYRNQPGRIEDYMPGRSSVVDKEAKQWWDEVMDIFDGQLANASVHQPPTGNKQSISSSSLSKSYMARALKESGYESDSTLVFRRREGAPTDAGLLSPREQRQAYREVQAGGEPPLQGFRKPAPDRPKESPRRYVESDVNIHYRVPVRQEPRPLVPEEELARKQADHMRRVYQEERRRKYLQELQDMNSRRHTDNFTPSQKSPISLNRYDTFGSTSSLSRGHQIARALHNFTGQGTRELTFRRGDLILVRRRIDTNWYEGETDSGQVGLFPLNYVEILEIDNATTLPPQTRTTEGRARAKFNFVAQTHLELGLKKGELVVLTRRVDDNWYEGRLAGRKGIFPVSYVEVLAEPQHSRPELPTSISSAKPVASPAAHSIMGAAGAASLGAHHYTPQINNPNLSNSPSSTAPLPNHGITNHHARPASATLPRASDPSPVNLNNHEPLFVDTNAEAVPYRAMYKYRPQNPDELELQEGDTVYVLEKCDDGWYVGSSQRTGRFGTFPGNYVEKI